MTLLLSHHSRQTLERWSLVRSGIQSVPLSPEMEKIKESVKAKLTPSLGGGFSSPGAISAFLVAVVYAPSSVRVDDAEHQYFLVVERLSEIFSLR